MENFVRQSLLFDFYGDLLSNHQKDVYEAYVCENLSLNEIAEDNGISRQAVHDSIKRTGAQLEKYESTLNLVENFLQVKEMVGKIGSSASLEEAKKIAEKILELM